jgi:hypothetical protein
MQRRRKHTFPTIEAVSSAWAVQSGYKEDFSRVDFRDASLPEYDLQSKRIELAVAE